MTTLAAQVRETVSGTVANSCMQVDINCEFTKE